jgi:(1->4)-alpha-D-glucan 1-alpha-D-glucosylmutase
MEEGLPKLWTIHHALCLRSEQRDWFGADAAYQPLNASGRHAECVLAFARGGNVITVGQRLSLRREGEWEDTRLPLPDGTWLNRLTGERLEIEGGREVALSALLMEFPVALLTLC